MKTNIIPIRAPGPDKTARQHEFLRRLETGEIQKSIAGALGAGLACAVGLLVAHDGWEIWQTPLLAACVAGFASGAFIFFDGRARARGVRLDRARLERLARKGAHHG